MKEEEFRAACVACCWYGEYTDFGAARADALGHDDSLHAGAATAVLASSSGTIQA